MRTASVFLPRPSACLLLEWNGRKEEAVWISYDSLGLFKTFHTYGPHSLEAWADLSAEEQAPYKHYMDVANDRVRSPRAREIWDLYTTNILCYGLGLKE